MNNIKKLRKEYGYSQLLLADFLDVNQTAVSQWERGITLPNTQTLFNLCEIFDTTIDFLLGRTTLKDRLKINDYQDLNIALQNPINKEILEILQKLDLKLQKVAIIQIKALLDIRE